MLAAYILIASILLYRSRSSETSTSSTGPNAFRLFGQTIQVQPPSEVAPHSTVSLYSKPNNEYTESDLQRLGFTHEEPIPATGSKLSRARCQKPFDRHEGNRFVSHSKDGPVYETNAQYVDRTMLYNRKRSRTNYERGKELRQALQEETGVTLPKKWATRWRERRNRALENPDQIVQFKHASGALYNDPKGRTGEQYYKERLQKEHDSARKYYRHKKASRKQ